ncbi:MAG: hypothetical protein JNJ77_20875 [Planctomycetia bacterium]|nr:hypothetical protein [Planctomycetia bacterium]
MTLRNLLTLAFVALATSSIMAQGQLEKLKREYNQARAQAREQAIKTFDQMINQVRKANMSGSARTSLMTKLTQDKQYFIDTGSWPENDDLAAAAFDYSRLINAKSVPLMKEYEQRIDQLLKANDLPGAQTITKEKENFERELPGMAEFTGGTKWEGTRSGPTGKNSRMRLDVHKKTGTTFDGHIHLDPGVANHPVVQVRGTITGNYVEIVTVKMINGANRNLLFSGYVYGNKLIMKIGGRSTENKPVNDRAWLKKS